MSKPKTSWPACVACGDPDGALSRQTGMPRRYSGAPWGLDGELCRACYAMLTYHSPHSRARVLVRAVQLFDAAMGGNDTTEQARRYDHMVRLAAALAGRRE